MERAYVAGYLYLVYVDQKIPDWPVKIAFLGKVEIATRLDIKRWFGGIGLAQVTAFWASIFFNNQNLPYRIYDHFKSINVKYMISCTMRIYEQHLLLSVHDTYWFNKR